VGVFGVADQALDLGIRRVRSKQKAPLAVRKTLWRMPGDFPKNVNGRPKKARSNHPSALLRFSNTRATDSRMLKGRGIQLQ
jgi:hypothetical protein